MRSSDGTEIKTGAALHSAILRGILDRDPDAAQAASHDLNDYLVEFSYATLRREHNLGPR